MIYREKIQTHVRKMIRRVCKHPLQYAAVAVSIFVVLAYTIGNMNRQLTIDPATYKPLLDLIARAESKGNYNAHFGNVNNTGVHFTEMSVTEVLDWQKMFVSQGNPSSAVGRYQFIDTTLAKLMQQLGLDGSELFDEALQDRLAIVLLEQRGAVAYINGRINKRQFAAELAKEWAGLPKVLGDSPEQSYYAGDGLNVALVSVNEVLRVVDNINHTAS